MTWRYTFDDGPEKTVETFSTLYQVAAMAAFARETLTRFPEVRQGINPYDGHVLKIWDDRLVPGYGPYLYGIGFNECVSLQIVSLGDCAERSREEVGGFQPLLDQPRDLGDPEAQ